MRVAVIGSGIAGLAAARALAAHHEVTVFEGGPRAGGHVYTVEADGHAIDMGFIVCNRQRYPNFFRMLSELGVATRPTTMSFSIADEHGEWSTSALFADRAQLLDRHHWRFLIEVMRFLRRARLDLDSSLVAGASLDEYLEARHWSAELRARFAIPLAAALWSLAPARCGAFPARTYLRFLDQHGMLKLVRPLPWETIVGGSQRYVAALLAQTRLDLRVSRAVERVERVASGVAIDGEPFDRAVVATPADTALRLLGDGATDDERRLLGAFGYSENRTVLHRDRAFLPRSPRLHAAWNHVSPSDHERVAVTYSMSKLQGLPDRPYLVTLNPAHPPRDVLHEAHFRHPQFDRAALAAQAEVPRLGGPRLAFAGAYLGYGFHEDGMRTGLAAAEKLG